ncbi:hypothetical protein [Massilia sp. NR 4-1]|uniref:hypothetical protein n=1 Tax=Massilia sp. NR 4-1 TaxID=1678028 RepID=UPI001680C02F|nr:hypothetical protein [Massilia sp. NR 4-1]
MKPTLTNTMPVPAKLARPSAPRVFRRARLHAAIDACLQQARVLWIAAPPGAGKTLLAVSWLDERKCPCLWYQIDAGDKDLATFFHYLGMAAQQFVPGAANPLPHFTTEYLADPETFARRYFERLGALLPARCVIVFDDLHEQASPSLFNQVLAKGLEHLPPEVQVLCLSRVEMPPPLARLCLTARLARLPAQSLELSEAESFGIAALHGTPMDQAGPLHRAVHGWAAGLVLLASRRRECPAMPLALAAEQHVLFSYFSHEVLRHFSPGECSFLVQCALLPTIYPDDAVQLTGYARAGKLLSTLQSQNYFTYQRQAAEGGYEFHPMFRDCLLLRLPQIIAADRCLALKRKAARILAARGEVAASIELLRSIGDWERLSELAISKAAGMVAQGRTRTLAVWLEDAFLHLAQEKPWLHYWLGICHLPVDVLQARVHLEAALTLFQQENAAGPLHLAWAALIDSFVFSGDELARLDAWLDRYPSLPGQDQGTAEMASAMFSYIGAMAYRRPGDPGLPKYAALAEQLLEREAVLERKLAHGAILLSYHLHRGDILCAERLLQALPHDRADGYPSPLVHIRWQTLKALQATITGAHEAATTFAQAGLRLAETSGISYFNLRLMWFCIVACLHSGKLGEARSLADRIAAALPPRANVFASLYYSASLGVSLQEGDFARAIADGQRSIEFAQASGVPDRIVLAMAYAAYARAKAGDACAAMREMAATRAVECQVAIPMTGYVCGFLESSMLLQHGHRPASGHCNGPAVLRQAGRRATLSAGAGGGHSARPCVPSHQAERAGSGWRRGVAALALADSPADLGACADRV